MNESTAPRRNRPTPGRYYILTWGCQMNVHDSEKLAGSLEQQGYARAAGARDADVILLNTCAIREKAAEKVFSELGRLKELKRRNPDLVIAVCGCVAQQEGSRIYERAPYVDLVVGPRATRTIPQTLLRILSGEETARGTTDTEYRDDSIHFPFDRIRREGVAARKAYVTIVEGCNHRCTFCIVPQTRGREICRTMDDILSEVRQLASTGVLEVEFLGQTVNAYRDPSSGKTLADLLLATAEIEEVGRIRFTTSHPAQMTDFLMDAMARARPKVCPYLHLPVQSGSDDVLKAMRRGYDRNGYLGRIDRLRQRLPGIALGTDVIVGFPTEGEAEFEQTLALLDEVAYDTLYSFAYSPRPGTAALALYDPADEATKLERLGRLQAHQRAIQERVHRSWVGREVEVLVEGSSKRNPFEWCGRTPENRLVNFAGPSQPGSLERIQITASSAFALRGLLVSA